MKFRKDLQPLLYNGDYLISLLLSKLSVKYGYSTYDGSYFAWVNFNNNNDISRNDFDITMNCFTQNDYDVNEIFSAPNQSKLQRHLREKHNIFVDVETMYDDDLEQIFYNVSFIHKDMIGTTEEYENKLEKFNNYEVALEHGLYYAMLNYDYLIE